MHLLRRILSLGGAMLALGSCEFIGETPFDLGSVGPVDIVTAATSPGLTIEVDAVAGTRPGVAVDNRVLATITELTAAGAFDKPDGVRFVDDDLDLEPVGDEDTVHTFGELRTLQSKLRTIEADDTSAVIHLLWVTGHYEDDSESSAVLGFAYDGDRIVMLADNIRRACENSILPGVNERLCERTTSTVLIHELGHLFGLVNNGTPMVADHQDTEHGAHDVDEDCIMFFAAETSQVADLLAERFGFGDEGEPPFDEACLADLQALVAANGS